MLRKLLALLTENRMYTVNEIANELDVSTETIERMVKDLIRLGYVKAICASSCNKKACSGCSKGSVCGGPFQNARLWELTEKGRGALISHAGA